MKVFLIIRCLFIVDDPVVFYQGLRQHIKISQLQCRLYRKLNQYKVRPIFRCKVLPKFTFDKFTLYDGC